MKQVFTLHILVVMCIFSYAVVQSADNQLTYQALNDDVQILNQALEDQQRMLAQKPRNLTDDGSQAAISQSAREFLQFHYDAAIACAENFLILDFVENVLDHEQAQKMSCSLAALEKKLCNVAVAYCRMLKEPYRAQISRLNTDRATVLSYALSAQELLEDLNNSGQGPSA